MKRKLALILLLMMMIAIVGCSSGKKNSNSLENEVVTVENAENILVVYFSYTGNTRQLANEVHEMVGGDIVEIKPTTPYSDNYDEVVDQGKKEEEEDYKPEIETKVNNIDSYDLILIGSPIWWYQIAPPVKTFLEENNLEGKNVALFTTHGGYGSGQSDENIQKLCAKSTISKSFTVEGDEVKNSKDEVSAWLKELDIKK